MFRLRINEFIMLMRDVVRQMRIGFPICTCIGKPRLTMSLLIFVFGTSVIHNEMFNSYINLSSRYIHQTWFLMIYIHAWVSLLIDIHIDICVVIQSTYSCLKGMIDKTGVQLCKHRLLKYNIYVYNVYILIVISCQIGISRSQLIYFARTYVV